MDQSEADKIVDFIKKIEGNLARVSVKDTQAKPGQKAWERW